MGLLAEDEWIGFQVMEGPCSVGCDYCYERSKTLELLKKAKTEGKIDFNKSMSNSELAMLIKKNQEKLGFFTDLKVFEKYFDFFLKLGIYETFLVGSEPTEHPNFNEILNLAERKGIKILVYTSGRNMEKLNHRVIKYIVLHYYKNEFTNQINDLLKMGKEIHLRINFDSYDMKEKYLIFNFYNGILPEYRKSVLLKYSFTTKLSYSSNNYFDLSSMKKITLTLLSFIDEFKSKYPDVEMYSERPLFPCCFSENDWKKYEKKGGFVSSCRMEFVVYNDGRISLCPPARDLIEGFEINNSSELKEALIKMQYKVDKLILKPSFEQCVNCEKRISKICQGGCLGYKI